jgi:hypothetical protein
MGMVSATPLASPAALCLRSISFGGSARIMMGRLGCSTRSFLRWVRFGGSGRLVSMDQWDAYQPQNRHTSLDFQPVGARKQAHPREPGAAARENMHAIDTDNAELCLDLFREHAGAAFL